MDILGIVKVLKKTGLDREVWSSDTGQSINPTFKEDQTDLPANLQIRKAITSAIILDKKYQENIVDGNDLARQRAEWYQSLLENMSKKAQIQPAEEPLK